MFNSKKPPPQQVSLALGISLDPPMDAEVFLTGNDPGWFVLSCTLNFALSSSQILSSTPVLLTISLTDLQVCDVERSEYVARSLRHQRHSYINQWLTVTFRTSSPFWGRRSSASQANQTRGKIHDPNIVVGASYSHADLLKFDSL